MVEVITLATRRRILTEDELNLIGGADVRGLPGSDVASSILPPSEVENGKKLELVEIGTNLIVKGEMDAAKKKQFCQGLSICSLARTDGRDAKAVLWRIMLSLFERQLFTGSCCRVMG